LKKADQPDRTSSGSPGRIRYFATRRLDFGNNLSTFDWIFGATYLQEEPSTEFGLGDNGYDHENIVTEILNAFQKPRPS